MENFRPFNNKNELITESKNHFLGIEIRRIGFSLCVINTTLQLGHLDSKEIQSSLMILKMVMP